MSSAHSRSTAGSTNGHVMTEDSRSRLKALTDTTCADCELSRPGWASLIRTPSNKACPNNVSTIAAFICQHCASQHRSLGTHICRVKSCSLDEWNEKELWSAEIGGNIRVNSIFEALLNSTDSKPTQQSTSAERASFIREKYVDHKFLDVSKYALCRFKRTQSILLDEDESIASGTLTGFSALSPPQSSHRRMQHNLVTPNIVEPSLFFSPRVLGKGDDNIHDDADDDMFADSATTTSDLFGHDNSTPMRARRRSFDGAAIEEEAESQDDNHDEKEEDSHEMPYPKLANSSFAAFSTGSTFNTSGAKRGDCGSPGPLQRIQEVVPLMPQLDVESLEKQKKEAIANEDFLKAAEIKRQIEALMNPSVDAEIESLESLKKLAVRQEDYVRAAELKARIDELRNKGRSNRQAQVESSIDSIMALPKRKTSQHPASLETFFGQHTDSQDDSLLQNKEMEEKSFQLDADDDIRQRKSNSSEDISERFSRSIAEFSQNSKLDNMGFVVNESNNSKEEEKESKPSPPKIVDSSSSRRSRGVPIRDSRRDRNGTNKPRSRSCTPKEKLRQNPTDKEKNEDKNEIQQRERSKSRDRKPQKEKHSTERSKSMDRKSTQKKTNDRFKSKEQRSDKQKDRCDPSNSRCRDTREEKSRDRSKSKERSRFDPNKTRDRSKSKERHSDKGKENRNRSKSRDRKNAEKRGRSDRDSRPSASNQSSSRTRSKSRLRREFRRKPATGSSRKLNCAESSELKRSSSSSQPFVVGSPTVPTTKEFSKSLPECSVDPFSPKNPRKAKRDAEMRRRLLMGVETIDTNIHGPRKTQDDPSVDGSFKTFASDNVQSAHQRTSTGRVAMSRRSFGNEDKALKVSPGGSQSLHVSNCSLADSFDFDALQSKNFFSPTPRPPITSPSDSRSGNHTRSFDTPAASPFRKRQLSIVSPTGVEECPTEIPPATPDEEQLKPIVVTTKYKEEVNRTVARLERLREMRRTSSSAPEESEAKVVSAS